jgi:hypothetical protein
MNTLSVYLGSSNVRSFHLSQPSNPGMMEVSSGERFTIHRSSTYDFRLCRGSDVWLESKTVKMSFHRVGEIWINNAAVAEWHGSFWDDRFMEILKGNQQYSLISRRASGFFNRNRPFDVIDSNSARLGKITIMDRLFKSRRICGEYEGPDNLWLIAFLATYLQKVCLMHYAHA